MLRTSPSGRGAAPRGAAMRRGRRSCARSWSSSAAARRAGRGSCMPLGMQTPAQTAEPPPSARAPAHRGPRRASGV